MALTKFIFFTIVALTLSPQGAFATGRDVIIKTFMTSNEKESSEAAEAINYITLKIKMRCVRANLRYISNPLASDGLLTPNVTLTTSNGVRRVFRLTGEKIKGSIANSSSLNVDSINQTGLTLTCTSKQDSDCKPGVATAVRAKGFRYGYIFIKMPIDDDDMVDLWDNGADKIKFPNISLGLIQSLPKPERHSHYRGFAGNLTFDRSRYNWDASGRVVTMTVTTHGEEGYCGGYHSPLVLYFNNDRPQYTGVSQFDLFGSGGLVYWPEKGSKAYFLALDQNKNGIIDRENELFGNMSEDYDNGFEKLRELDSNKDNVIDQKDKDFDRLVLWNDSTGKGQCKKKDLYTLKQKGVEQISLKYDKFIRPFGGRAEEKAEASFLFRSIEKGQPTAPLVEGKIIDVWFARPTVITSR